jgi:hypothetical protein
MPPKTQREREAEQRQAKLDRIDEQVKDGSLVIRKMTDEERARFEPKRGGAGNGRDAAKRRRRARAGRPLPPVPKT